MATLDGFPQSPRCAVFRALEGLIRHDPVIAANVRTIWSWTGLPTDDDPPTIAMCPWMRISPAHGPDDWRFPEAFTGYLFLQVELMVAGYDADDLMNFWWAVQRAIYPKDQAAKTTNIAALRAAGAYPGTAEFTLIPAPVQPDSNFQQATGQIRIQIMEQLST